MTRLRRWVGLSPLSSADILQLGGSGLALWLGAAVLPSQWPSWVAPIVFVFGLVCIVRALIGVLARVVAPSPASGPAATAHETAARPPMTRLDPNEDSNKLAEREGIQREGRKAAQWYRAMARLNGIRDTTGDVKLTMQDRVTKLQARRDTYRDRWKVNLPLPSLLEPSRDAVDVEWLEAMAHAADAVVWQLDHES